MWAWPDVLQYPWQLPVCGHTLSRHLQAGLQPRVRLSVPGQGQGGTGNGEACYLPGAGQRVPWLLCGWAPFPGHVSGRHMGSTLPELQGRASVPTGKCALRKSTCLQPLGARACLDSTVSHPVMPQQEPAALGAGRGRERMGCGRAAGVGMGMLEDVTHMGTHERTQSPGHRNRHTNDTQKHTQNPRTQTHTDAQTQNTLPPHGPLRLRTLIKTHGHGDLGRQELHLQRQESILGRDLPWALLCGGGGVPLQG